MNEIELKRLNLVELNSTYLHETNGGLVWYAALVAAGLYIVYETAGNPVSSYNSFMAGWNAA
ncbi:MAG: hypothetical protein EHM93_04045 [Bacteroidales bacterium]|nr:MAG: hypothetical protein EHM93_04045 [Bacteroidales bacterium]